VTHSPDIERQSMPSDTFPALGEPLALELANTLFTDGATLLDALTTPDALTRWVEANSGRIDARPPRRPGPYDLERARELRATIRALLAAAVDGGAPSYTAVRRLNELAAMAPFTPRLHWPASGRPTARLSLSRDGRADALLALLAQSAIDVLGGSGAGRVRRCQAPGCGNYFVKDHPHQVWCSPSCGNRARVARHYQRTR
jgi:predicted RNA-binding Zn ribbon-like protein